MTRVISAVRLMHARTLALLLFVSVFLNARTPLGAQASSPTSPFGTQLRLALASQVVHGELLAVTADSLWVFKAPVTMAIARSEIRKIDYKRHNFDSRRAAIAGGVVSGASTAAIAAACMSYNMSEGNGGAACAYVTTTWLASTAIATALTALFTRPWRELPLTEWEALTVHARFPQGLPSTYQRTPAG